MTTTPPLSSPHSHRFQSLLRYMFIARRATRSFTRTIPHHHHQILRTFSTTVRNLNKMSEEEKKQIKTAFPVSHQSPEKTS